MNFLVEGAKGSTLMCDTFEQQPSPFKDGQDSKQRCLREVICQRSHLTHWTEDYEIALDGHAAKYRQNKWKKSQFNFFQLGAVCSCIVV